MITSAKRLMRRIFNAVGLDVHKLQPTGISRMSMAGSLRQLALLGLKPQTVIDVGVAYHTQELYEEFREANILLIEPLAEFEPFLRKICATYNAQYVLAAAAETAGMAVLNVHRDKVGSSLLKEVEGAAVDGAPRQVPVVTIDERLCGERPQRAVPHQSGCSGRRTPGARRGHAHPPGDRSRHS